MVPIMVVTSKGVYMSGVMSREMLELFAEEHGITIEKAESLVANIYYRAEYAKKYNRKPEVKAARRVREKKEGTLRKAMKDFARS